MVLGLTLGEILDKVQGDFSCLKKHRYKTWQPYCDRFGCTAPIIVISPKTDRDHFLNVPEKLKYQLTEIIVKGNTPEQIREEFSKHIEDEYTLAAYYEATKFIYRANENRKRP